MTLFEIEIDKNFKIQDKNVFFNRQDFEKYYKLNSLNDENKDNISKYLLKDLSLSVCHNLFVMPKFTYEIEEVSNIIKSNIYLSNVNSNEETLYPEWMLFYISIAKKKVHFISEIKFRTYLKYFEYIAEVRYKKYVIRNIKNFIHYKHHKNSNEIRDTLFKEFLEYLGTSKFKTEELFDFLNFLYSFHNQLKENEKYKLMWNLETYIIETVKLLIDNGNDITYVYKEIYKSMRGTYSVLHDIHKHKSLYIEERKGCFQSYLSKLNNVFQIDITLEELMKTLILNEKYTDTLFAYLELLKRLNANKVSVDVLGAIIKGIVLGIEEHIKDFIQEPKKLLIKCLEKLCDDIDLFDSIRLEIKDEDKNILLSNLNRVCLSDDISLEKYLSIYHNSRNYLAHNNINMSKFFFGDDGSRIIISNVMDSIIIILYKLNSSLR